MKKTFWVGMIVVAMTAGIAVGLGTLYSTGSADLITQDRQPLAFSHEFHAGQLNVACVYCHRAAEQSATAGIPSVQLCLSCHRNLDAQTPDTNALLAYWQERKPIPWVRLQRLPDFVYFTHQRHLGTGLQCAECHGTVEHMRYTPRAATYEMGWCLSCHTQRGASRDCWTCHK